MSETYDYIIVGAGSSGCALANRLSADPANSVLLIEAGPVDDDMFVHMPRGLGILTRPGNKRIWEYQVKTGDNGKAERWFRGKTLGGSSSINGMIYMRGSPMDYDNWEQNLGCEGWGWNEIGKKFVEMEDHDQGAGEWRGEGGELHIQTHEKGNKLFEALLDAGAEMGVPRVKDVNHPDNCKNGGLGYQPTTRYKNTRWSSAAAFLTPIKDKRSNLTVMPETQVLKVEFDGQRATGVTIREGEGETSIKASKEIILSGGAFQTPKLLQLSGIGPAKHLEALGIPVVVDAPGVGQNLREHRHVDLRLKVTEGSMNKDLNGINAVFAVLRYKLFKTGVMAHAAHEIGGFAKSRPDLDHADLQFGLMSLSASEDENGNWVLNKFPSIMLVTYFTRPESQGELLISSADPDAPLNVNMRHLSAEIDRERFIAAYNWNRNLVRQPAMKDYFVEELDPYPSINTDDEILANAMNISGTCFHSAGTARMGVDDGAVCDPRLRVKGVEGLRVADTSIFPTLVSGNTNGPAMVTGLKAAEMILQDHAG